jgi:eukaryotic-like serine/threonine-protein kinase
VSSVPGGHNPSSAKNVVDLPVRTGQVLEGKFRVERIIGEGAMGLVVEATHLALEERVALKFLRREARARPEIVARFAREARAAAKIKSDHVARVYDVGGSDDGSPFIVMEFLEGMDLEVVLAKSGPIDVTDAVEHVIQACEGLTAAHTLGIVHRDIKPANLFRVDRGGIRHIKLLDFGISKAGISGTFEDIDLVSANTTQIMGSPHYMSPEQIRSTKDVDTRADIWSLGVVLYELITGDMPFTATDVTGIIAQVLHEPHRRVRSLVPDVPQGLEEVIDHCLQKDPAKRYQAAADLAVALLPFAPKRARAVVERTGAMMARASGHTPVADSVPPPPQSSPTFTKATKASGAPVLSIAVPSHPPPDPARSPFVWVALACVILGLTGGALAAVARFRQSPTALARATPAATAVVAETASPGAGIAAPVVTGPGPGASIAAGIASASAQPPSPPTETTRPAAPRGGRSGPAARPSESKSKSSTLPPSESEIRRER